MKVKCANCGTKRKLEDLRDEFSRLLLAYGSADRNGRRQMTVYCRDCRYISYYVKPTIGFTKLKICIDSRLMYAKHREGAREDSGLCNLAAKIQLALIEDRVLPETWVLV
ncbi:MAG: hypothetical protein AB8B48_15270 [Pseudomonadales bacterium]